MSFDLAPPPKRKDPPVPTATHSEEDNDVPPPSPMEKRPKTAPKAAKKVAFSGSRPEIRAEQQTRRSAAKTALESLRRNQIPGYDPSLADTERDVVIDSTLFRSLREDSAAEFQDANKPPWAPRVPKAILDKIRTWEVMETLSELDKRRDPWYMLAWDTAGALGLQPEAIILQGPNTASADAVKPSRSQTAEAPAVSAGTTLGVGGAASVGQTLAGLTTATPFREPTFNAPVVDEGARRAAFERFRRRAQMAGETTTAPVPPPPVPGPATAPPEPEEEDFGLDVGGSFLGGGPPATPRPPVPPPGPPTPAPPPVAGGGRTLPAMSAGEIEDLLLLETQNLLATQRLPQSGARYREFREAREEKPEWYERDSSDLAINTSQRVRAQGARARSWIARPLATGVFYLSPTYTSARDDAYTQIVSRADQLADVDMKYFARLAPTNSVQFRVRRQFIRLIAEFYRLTQHGGNRSAKLAADAANITASIEAITQFFVNRVTFEWTTREFRDTGAAGALNRQKPWRHATFTAPSGRFGAAYNDTRSNPLLVRQWPGQDVRYTPGTLLGPLHQI